MKKRKLLSILSALTLSAAILSGCSAAAPTPAPAPASSAPSEAAPAQPADPAPAAEQTITFYGFSDWIDTEPFKAVYEQAKAEFESENPGITVELQSDPWGDWEQKYKTMFASGNPADVFMVNNPDFPVFANNGNVLDIGAYTEEGYFDRFFPGVLSMYQWMGKNMAIPFTTDCRILWYNKEIFTEAGLDPNAPPATWPELVSAAKQIKDTTGKYGFGMDMGLQEIPSASLICASGSQLITVTDAGVISPNVNTPEFRQYLQTLIDMKDTFEPDYATLDHHNVATQFAEGQFGMIIGNTLTETDIYSKDFWAQALVPSLDAATAKGSFGGGFGIAVSRSSAAPEAAVKFAQKLCDPKFNGGLVSDIPASQAGLDNSKFVTDPNYEVILEQIQYAKQTMPKTLYYSEIEAAVYDTVVQIVVGEADIDSAITALEERINQIVNS